jgi:hypothetical protein
MGGEAIASDAAAYNEEQREARATASKPQRMLAEVKSNAAIRMQAARRSKSALEAQLECYQEC